jgi:hypothetical protein
MFGLSMPASLRSGLDKGKEELDGEGIIWQIFRVPLDGVPKGVTRQLNRLDQTV